MGNNQRACLECWSTSFNPFKTRAFKVHFLYMGTQNVRISPDHRGHETYINVLPFFFSLLTIFLLMLPLGWAAGWSHLSLPAPLALILGSVSWQPHPLSYRLAGTQWPRSSFSNTMHSPAIHLPFNSHHIPSVHLLLPSHSFSSFLRCPPALSNSNSRSCDSGLSGKLEALGGPEAETGLAPYLRHRAARVSETSQSSQKPLSSETKVVRSIIQTGATPTAASATLTLTNGQKNRWFVHSWPV